LAICHAGEIAPPRDQAEGGVFRIGATQGFHLGAEDVGEKVEATVVAKDAGMRDEG
jgi:hypothetical protein